ncbi:MAG TPA: M48 family metalloprotease [Actinocatenispora sp.]
MRGAAVGAAVLLVALGVLVAVAVPWRWARPSRPARTAARESLPSDEVARGRRLHRELRPSRYVRLAVELAVALVLGLTPVGGDLVAAVGDALGTGRLVTALVGGLVVGALTQVVGLPVTAWRRTILRRYGLLTQGFAGWLADLARGAALGLVLGGGVLTGFFALTGAWPGGWWLPLAGAGALLSVLLSLVFPVLVEPLFNRFTPMPASPLRDELLALAAADGVPVRAVLVADASRRTRAVNAYVSGFGPTRRIVVFDTLLSAAPDDEVRLVVAHELGHARYRDVVLGTALGAVGAALAACALYLLGGWHGLLALSGARDFADPRSIGLLYALATVGQLVSMPAGNLVSRRIEARADAHALAVTGEVDTFVAMQGRLALRNLADVAPPTVEHVLFDSHPSTVERIAGASAT